MPYKIDIDSELMRILKPAGMMPTMPKLIKFLRQRQAGRPPKLPFEKEFGVEEPKLPEEMLPKRASRGLVFPERKPTKSPLYPFLRGK